MGDKPVHLLERTGVEQEIHALARRQFASLVLTIETILPPAELGPAIEISQGVEWIAHALTACAFSPDNRYVATASADLTILIWEVAARKGR